MARQYDVFYGARDDITVEARCWSTIDATGGTDLAKATNTTFTLPSTPSPAPEPGDRVWVWSYNPSHIAHLEVVSYSAPTTLVVRPVVSEADTGTPFDHDWTATLFYSGTGRALQAAASLVIDLSDAPAGTYDYLILGNATLSGSATNTRAQARIRSRCKSGDQYSGDDPASTANFLLENASGAYSDSLNYSGATTANLTAGNRYEFHLEFCSHTAGATARAQYPRLVAFRYDASASSVVGTGRTAATAVSDINTNTTHLEITAGNIVAGDYLVVGSCVTGGQANGKNITTVCEAVNNSNAAVLAKALTTNSANATLAAQAVPCSFASYLTLDANSRLKIYGNSGTGTAEVQDGLLGAFKLYAAAGGSDYESAAETITPGTSFATASTSGNVSVADGRHVAISSFTTRSRNTSGVSFEMRPTFAGNAGKGFTGYVDRAASEDYHGSFFLERLTLTGGNKTVGIEGRRADGGTDLVETSHRSSSFVRERAALAITDETPVSIVAEVESGLLIRSWASVSPGYRKRLPDVDTITAIYLNGTSLAETASTSALNSASSGFFWDAAGNELWVKLESGTPNDVDQLTVAVAELRFGRNAEDLTRDGTVYPYRPRIQTVPGSTQNLQSNNGVFKVASTIGALKIASADGEFDDLLVQRLWEGLRARVWRGHSSLSTDRDDFEQIASGVLGLPSSSASDTVFQMFDTGLLAQREIETDSITVHEGVGATNRTTREDQGLPIVYGKVKRIPAYRTSIDSDTNMTYVAASTDSAYGGFTATAAYERVDSEEPMSATLTVSAADSRVTIARTGFTNSEPPDIIYLDGSGLIPNGGSLIETPGAIAEDILTRFSSLAATDLVVDEFRQMDRAWRRQMQSGALVNEAPTLGLIIQPATTAADALGVLASQAFFYWRANRSGRLGVRVPDRDADNLLENGAFETSASILHPWNTANSATIATTTSRKFEGVRSAEISNGSSPNASAYVWQDVILPTAGTYAISLVASQLSGNYQAFRIGVATPDGAESLSDAFEIDSNRWTRCTHYHTTSPGETGMASVRIYPAKGSTTATSVAIDNVQALRIAFLADSTNSITGQVQFEADNFYKAGVSYAVDLRRPEHASRATVTDVEAAGIAGAIPEGKHTVETSTRLDLPVGLFEDAASAAGVAASVAAFYGRPRHRMVLEIFAPGTIPTVGDRIAHRDLPRVGEVANGSPFWRVVAVTYEGENAQKVAILAEREMDPAIDRAEIAPDSFPLGASAFRLDASSPTDFTAVSGLGRKYLAASTAADIATDRGATSHQHTFTHTHTVAAHTHSQTMASHADEADYTEIVDGERHDYDATSDVRALIDTAASPSSGTALGKRAAADGSHSHTLAGALTSGAPVGASGSTAAFTALAATDAAHRLVRLLERTDSTASTIPEGMVVGYPSATIPAGWQRVTDLDGYYLKIAEGNASATTTTSSAITNVLTLAIFSVTSATGFAVGRRLTISQSSNTFTAVITSVSGTNIQAVPTYAPGDETPDVTSYTSGATATLEAETAGTAVAGVTHDHGATLLDHTHAADHAHAANAATATLGNASESASDLRFFVDTSGPFYQTTDTAAPSTHTHENYPTLPTQSLTSAAGGGSAISASGQQPAYYSLVWIKPADANQAFLPAGAVLVWTQSTPIPTGYETVGAADGLLLRGAASSAGPASGVGGHLHTATLAAHTIASHNHGGTNVAQSTAPNYASSGTQAGWGAAGSAILEWTNAAFPSATNALLAAARNFGFLPDLLTFDDGHSHAVTYNVGSTASSLEATTGTSSAVGQSDALPLHRRVVLISKN